MRAFGVTTDERYVVAATHDHEAEPFQSANDPIEWCVDRELHDSTVTAVSATKASITGDSVSRTVLPKDCR